MKNNYFYCRSFEPNKWRVQGQYLMHLDVDGKFGIKEDNYYKVSFRNINESINEYLLSTGNPAYDYLELIDCGTAKLFHDNGEVKLKFTIKDDARGRWIENSKYKMEI